MGRRAARTGKVMVPRVKRVWRRCLGPRPEEHGFWSDGPENRVCGPCRAAMRDIHLSPRLDVPAAVEIPR